MAKIDRMLVGESLVGEGNEVAHIDLIIGPRGSPVETAFANALTNNKDGFTSLLAVVAPNLLTKPATVMFNKVTIKGAKQAVLFAFLHSQQYRSPMPAIRLNGLDPNGIYRVRTIDSKLTGAKETYSGSYLMNQGVSLKLQGDYDSTSITFEKQP